jgi:hemerythrin superfamily protein
MDAIELLTSQHDEVESLFEQCQKANGMQKQAIFDQIADQLAVHAAIEEHHFYPAVKSADTEDLLQESVKEHYAMKQLIAELIDMGVDGEDFDEKLITLKEAVHHHAKDEEEPELFPRARELLDQETLEALAGQMTETMVTLESEGMPRNQVFEELEAPAPI